jgi:hypothetical protein
MPIHRPLNVLRKIVPDPLAQNSLNFRLPKRTPSWDPLDETLVEGEVFPNLVTYLLVYKYKITLPPCLLQCEQQAHHWIVLKSIFRNSLLEHPPGSPQMPLTVIKSPNSTHSASKSSPKATSPSTPPENSTPVNPGGTFFTVCTQLTFQLPPIF